MKRLEYASNQSNPTLQQQGVGEWYDFQGFETDPEGEQLVGGVLADQVLGDGAENRDRLSERRETPQFGEYASEGANVSREGRTFGQFAQKAGLKYKEADGKWRSILASHGGIDNPGLKEYAPIDALVAEYGHRMPPGFADKWRNSEERRKLVEYAEWWPNRNKGQSGFKKMLPFISMILPFVTMGLGSLLAPAAAGAGAAGTAGAAAGLEGAAALGAGVDAFGAAVPAGFAMSSGASAAIPAALSFAAPAATGGFSTLGGLSQQLGSVFPEIAGSSSLIGDAGLMGPGLDLAAGGAMDMGIGFGGETMAQLGLNSGTSLASSVGGYSSLGELMNTLKGLYNTYDKMPGVNKKLLRLLLNKGMQELNSQPKPPQFRR